MFVHAVAAMTNEQHKNCIFKKDLVKLVLDKGKQFVEH